MPGVIRRTGVKLTGPSRMPNDPLEAQRIDLANFDSLITALGACANSVSTAVNMLATAPKQLYDPLRQLYGHDAPGSASIAKMCSQLDVFSMRVRENEAEAASMLELLKAMSERNNAVRQSFAARDVYWSTQDHYLKKTDSIREQIMKSGSSPKLTEKLQRNEVKKQASIQEFCNATAETGQKVNAALSLRFAEIGEVLAKLCNYYLSVFQVSGQLVNELRDVSDHLASPMVSKGMLQMGQDIAQQASTRANQMMENIRSRGSPFAAEASSFGNAGYGSGQYAHASNEGHWPASTSQGNTSPWPSATSPSAGGPRTPWPASAPTSAQAHYGYGAEGYASGGQGSTPWVNTPSQSVKRTPWA